MECPSETEIKVVLVGISKERIPFKAFVESFVDIEKPDYIELYRV